MKPQHDHNSVGRFGFKWVLNGIYWILLVEAVQQHARNAKQTDECFVIGKQTTNAQEKIITSHDIVGFVNLEPLNIIEE